MSGAHGRARRRPPSTTLALRWAALLTIVGAVAVVGVEVTHGGTGTPAATSRPAVKAATTGFRVKVQTAAFSLPTAVSRPVAVVSGGSILLLGGLHAGDVSTASVVSVDPSRRRVAVVGSLVTAVHDAGGFVLGGRAYVVAGGAATTQSAVQAWSGAAAAVSGSLPVGRSDLAGAVVGRTGYVVGGFDGSALVPEILATRNGVSFATVGALAQPVRYPAVAALGGSVYVVGGALSTTEGTLAGPQTSDVQRFDPATGATTIIGHLPYALSHAMALVLGGQLYVLGGRSGETLSNAIWRIDTRTGGVAKVGVLAAPRSDAGAVVLCGVGYLLGGEVSGPTDPLSSVEVVHLTA